METIVELDSVMMENGLGDIVEGLTRRMKVWVKGISEKNYCKSH